MKITPREYQDIAASAALKALRGPLMRALVVLATGLGKTITAALISKRIRARRILFLVHNNFILKHAIDEFRLVFDEETVMVIYNGMSKEGAAEAQIVFATWQTMSGNLKRWARDHFDLIVVDEAHHTEATTYRPVAEYFTGPKLGITATPDREDEADIRDVFGPEVVNITLEEAIARGWLPRIEYHVVTDESLDENALQIIATEIRESKKRFTMAEVNRRIFIKKRDQEIAKIINGYQEKALVFCASIAHAERMSKSLVLASTFHSERGKTQKETWNKNQATLDALKNGLVRRVCAVNAFNEGVNVPTIGLVAFCRVTGVLTVFRQQLGRGLRPGKEKLIVLDFVGNLERIQLVVETMNKVSDLHEQFTPKEEIEREGYTRQPFEVSGKGFEFTFSDKVVDLVKVLEHCEREFYPTWQEASIAAQKLGLAGRREYEGGSRKDSRLPSNPRNTYADFPGWSKFLPGRKKGDGKYKTWQEASLSLIRWKNPSHSRYRARCAYDACLYRHPDQEYSDFPGWDTYYRRKYTTWQEAGVAAVRVGITDKSRYEAQSQQMDPRLPPSPYQYYKDFPGWEEFLGKEKTWRAKQPEVVSS